MAKISGTKRRRKRSLRKSSPVEERKTNHVPMPETKKSSASRQARGYIMTSDRASLVSALFKSHFMSGKKATDEW
jgi:hypothetical protein